MIWFGLALFPPSNPLLLCSGSPTWAFSHVEIEKLYAQCTLNLYEFFFHVHEGNYRRSHVVLYLLQYKISP